MTHLALDVATKFVILSTILAAPAIYSLTLSSEARTLIALILLALPEPIKTGGLAGLDFKYFPLQAVMACLILALPTTKSSLEPASLTPPIAQGYRRNIWAAGKAGRGHGALAAFVIFCAWATLSSVANGDIRGLVPWIASLFAVIRLYGAPRREGFGFKAILAIHAALTVTLFVEMLWHASGRGTNDISAVNGGRFAGRLGDYELLAELCGISAMLSLWLILRLESRTAKAYALGSLAVAANVLFATRTRGALLALLPSMVAIYILARDGRHLGRRAIAAVGTAAAMAGLAPYWLPEGFYDRWTIGRDKSSFAGQINRDGVWHWFTTLPQLKSGLWGAGNGFSYPYAALDSYPHSLYLYLAFCGGMAAVLGFVISTVLFMRLAFVAEWNQRVLYFCLVGYILIDQIKIEYTRIPSLVIAYPVIISLSGLLDPARTAQSPDRAKNATYTPTFAERNS